MGGAETLLSQLLWELVRWLYVIKERRTDPPSDRTLFFTLPN